MPQIMKDSNGGEFTSSSGGVGTATLTLGGMTVTFPYNPNSTEWQYQLNTQYINTYGGYVEQLLSVSVQNILFQGDAGSRKKLLRLYAELLSLQQEQIRTQSSALLVIPTQLEESGSISLDVWFTNISLGIDPTTVTHPYRALFQISEGNYGSLKDRILSSELSKITESLGFGDGIGFYDNGFYQGLNKSVKMTMGQISDLLYIPKNTPGEWNF